MVQRQDGPVRSGRFQLGCQPVQLVVTEFPMMEAGHRGVHGDNPQAVDVVAVVHRGVIARLVQQPCPKVGPVIVVSHGPDDFGAQILAGRIDDCSEFGVSLGISLIRQVTGENYGFGAGP
jgi:hypothetical protein